jgi:uncharacterized protein YdbL (DUF1318 family)
MSETEKTDYIVSHRGSTYEEIAEKLNISIDEIQRIDSQKRRDVFLRIEMSRIHKAANRVAKRLTHGH